MLVWKSLDVFLVHWCTNLCSWLIGGAPPPRNNMDFLRNKDLFSRIYSQMNGLIENEYISGRSHFSIAKWIAQLKTNI